ncbi:MAG: PfkB family carbohydrate kinase [Myxococcota bacterium]
MSSPMLVVGSVAFDTLHNHLGTHPKVLGGSATYASIAGSYFAPVQLVGVVGRDFPDEAVKLLESRKIDLEGLEVADGLTFHWEGRYSDDLTSRETLKTDLNVFADFHPKLPAAWRDTPYVMLGNIDPNLQIEVLDQINEPKLVIADTMNLWIDIKLDDLKRMLKRIDVLILNEEEGRQLTQEHNIVKVAKELCAMGPERVVVKRGEYGALLFEPGDVFSAPAYPVEEVQDPTGAGDTFAGGFLGFVARQDSVDAGTLRRAVVYGSAAASRCVEGVGPNKLAGSSLDEIQERYLAFARLAHFATDSELGSIK